jgi:hypothetical protein
MTASRTDHSEISNRNISTSRPTNVSLWRIDTSNAFEESVLAVVDDHTVYQLIQRMLLSLQQDPQRGVGASVRGTFVRVLYARIPERSQSVGLVYTISPRDRSIAPLFVFTPSDKPSPDDPGGGVPPLDSAILAAHLVRAARAQSH